MFLIDLDDCNNLPIKKMLKDYPQCDTKSFKQGIQSYHKYLKQHKFRYYKMKDKLMSRIIEKKQTKEIAKRINIVRTTVANKTWNDFAKELNISRTVLACPTSSYTLYTIVKICELYNISADWLIFGDGDMHW